MHPELENHIMSVMSLINVAARNRNIFLQLLNRTYPKSTHYATKDLSFFDKSVNPKNALTLFDHSLKKSITHIKTYTLKNSSKN